MKLEEKQITHKLIYECFFMKLYEDKVLLPNGKESTRIYLEHPGAAAVLAVTKEGKLLLIRQYRYPVREELIEIPAGKKDTAEEDGLDCAKRELEEETGYVSEKIIPFGNIHSCVGYSDERIELFLATDCVKKEHPKQGDDDEFLEMMLVSKDEAKALLREGKITDAKTLIALQKYLWGPARV